ncbi:MAG: CHAT domain-containing protein [Bryobacterales bacterium]
MPLGADGQRREATADHRFAANVATQLIRMGVRAVIAAGWAVDDAPAKAFADVFYDHMLKGAEFGYAVREGAPAHLPDLWAQQHMGSLPVHCRRPGLPAGQARRRGKH